MITAIYSIGKVTGAEFWVWGYFISTLIFAAISLLFRANRTKNGIITIALGLLVAEILCDTAWFLIYYPGGSYANYGIGGVYGLFIWPALLIIVGVIGTGRNRSRKQSEVN